MKSTDNSKTKIAVMNQEIKDAQYWENKVADAMHRVRQALAAGKGSK